MRPASRYPNPAANSGLDNLGRWRLILVVGAMAYTFLLGLGLLARIISPESGYLWMAILCLAPLGWHAYGFWRVPDREQDAGLLISAIGWALLILALIIKYSFALSSLRAGTNPNAAAVAHSPAAFVCVVVALLCLLTGAIFSWRGWHEENRGSAGY